MTGTETWGACAERLLEQALDEVRDRVDAIGTVDGALTALRIEAGELPPDDDLLADGETVTCICPPDLVARGGFRSTCPACAPFPVA